MVTVGGDWYRYHNTSAAARQAREVSAHLRYSRARGNLES
jgi:hypothetical protein